MKKISLSAMAFALCMSLTSCGSGSSILGDLANTPITSTGTAGSETTTSNAAANLGGILGDIISSVTGGALTNQNSLQGTWVYAKPCVQFESGDLLSQAGGSVMAEKIENTLTTYYEKAGIKAGSTTFVFNKDNSLQYTLGSKTYNGTYSFDATKKTVTVTTATGQNLTAYVSIVNKQMGLTFDVSNLLKLIQNSKSSQLSNISTIAKNYKGMKLGFEFKK